jgi:hypothetical protein
VRQTEEIEMDYVKPADVAKAMAETGLKKLALPPRGGCGIRFR